MLLLASWATAPELATMVVKLQEAHLKTPCLTCMESFPPPWGAPSRAENKEPQLSEQLSAPYWYRSALTKAKWKIRGMHLVLEINRQLLNVTYWPHFCLFVFFWSLHQVHYVTKSGRCNSRIMPSNALNPWTFPLWHSPQKFLVKKKYLIHHRD